MAAVAISTLTPVAPALAQEQRRVEYKMEAGDLGDALKTVSRLSGKEIIFTSEAVLGHKSPALRGTYSADDAVRALIEGSDLIAQFRKDVIIIRGRSEAPGDLNDRPAEALEITVTGSRIRGVTTPSPVISTTRDTIIDQGQTDLGSYFRSLPQNFSGGQNPGVVGSQGQSENTNGSSTINLRGLGADATLTLVNGHRSAYDAVAQGVDIGAIPLAAIDRVEVVTDGASALYGSDAVAGVANVLLRRDAEGLESSARLGGATDGGDFEQQYTVAGGHRWRGGGFIATFEYADATPVLAGQRSYTNNLDRGATIFSGQKQLSMITAGHQQIANGLRVEFDGQFSRRTSDVCAAAVTAVGCLTNGSTTHRMVQSFYVSPNVVADLANGWQIKLTATHAESDTRIHTENYVIGNRTATFDPKYNNKLDNVELGAEGTIISLPGGNARAAVGGGFRRITQDTDYRQTTGGITTPVWLYSQARETVFAYGELSIPIFGPTNARSLVRELSFTAAMRYESNTGFENLVTPKLGIVYRPLADITLRGSWGRSFKAPTLFQVGRGVQGYLLPSAIFSPPPARQGTAIFLLGGRAGLAPEKAETWTSTLSYNPSYLKGLSIDLTYFSTRYNDRVVTPILSLTGALSPTYRNFVLLNPTQEQILSQVANLPQGLLNQSGSAYDPSSVVAIVDNALVNAAKQSIDGIDLSAQLHQKLDAKNEIYLSGSASYIASSQVLSSGQSITHLSGTIFNPPKWRGRLSGVWKVENSRLGATVSYLGGTKDNRFTPYSDIGAFTTVDFFGGVTVNVERGALSGVEVDFSLTNAFNEKPEMIRTTTAAAIPFDSTNYSSIGRTISLTIKKTW